MTTLPGIDAMDRLLRGARGVLYCLKDRDGRYCGANDAFLRRARIRERADLLGRRAQEVFPTLLAAGYEQQDDLIFLHGKEMRDRLEMITNADGTLGWYLSDKVPVRDQENNVIGIASLSRDLKIPANDDPRIAQLAKAISHMRRNYAKPLRIAKLAQQSGMSLSKFERIMKAILQVSPRQLLTRLRVEAAAEQLRDGNEPIGDIALACGFYDQPTFARQFKATTGLTASQYRKWSRATATP